MQETGELQRYPTTASGPQISDVRAGRDHTHPTLEDFATMMLVFTTPRALDSDGHTGTNLEY